MTFLGTCLGSRDTPGRRDPRTPGRDFSRTDFSGRCQPGPGPRPPRRGRLLLGGRGQEEEFERLCGAAPDSAADAQGKAGTPAGPAGAGDGARVSAPRPGPVPGGRQHVCRRQRQEEHREALLLLPAAAAASAAATEEPLPQPDPALQG